jgi:hypothetical protein
LLARTRGEICAKTKGKRVFALLQIVLAVSVPLLQDSLTLHMLNDTIGNKALTCVSRTKEWVKGAWQRLINDEIKGIICKARIMFISTLKLLQQKRRTLIPDLYDFGSF